MISSGTTNWEAMIISWSVSLSNAMVCLLSSPALQDILNTCTVYTVAIFEYTYMWTDNHTHATTSTGLFTLLTADAWEVLSVVYFERFWMLGCCVSASEVICKCSWSLVITKKIFFFANITVASTSHGNMVVPGYMYLTKIQINQLNSWFGMNYKLLFCAGLCMQI